jgi:alkyl sulfatase BDS1-like metallo-beta-lactamase superfamily hydrolase
MNAPVGTTEKENPMTAQKKRDVSELFAKTVSGDLKQVADGVYVLPGFGNCTIAIGEDGIAVIDPGLFANGPRVVTEMRKLSDAPVRIVIYTHGHYDHAFGTPAILEDAAERGHAAPSIVGHVNVAKRFARYQKTAGHLAETYSVQFASWTRAGVLGGRDGGDVVRQARYFPPTLEYESRIVLSLGDLTLHCRHGLGETDDHTWVWIPERKTIVGGDFIVSSIPNAGAPFRVQRYVVEWAEALEEMAGLEPDAVVSGHGGIFRGDEAQAMLLTTARALRWLEDEVVRRLNAGQWYEEIVQAVDLPDDLKCSPYLQSLYGCPTFAVHAILRRYTGWYNGNPSTLFPSSPAAIAGEVLALAGGSRALIERAQNLATEGHREALQRALHLLDFVIFGEGEEELTARRLKAELLRARAEQETSFIARNILQSAALLQAEAAENASSD